MLMTSHREADKVIRQKFALARSSAWPKVSQAFRKAHPHCASCGETTQLNIHHKFPFHYVVLCGRPDLELDPRNLITLCIRKDCRHHLLLGHLDDYESYDPGVLKFVKTYAGKSAAEILANAAWKKARTARPKHLDKMTAIEKADFKKILDRKFRSKPALVIKAFKARENV